MVTQVERLARMEVEVKELKASFIEHKTETTRKFDEINDKLDDLLALRNKGAGVLWLLGGVGISGLFALVNSAMHWIGIK